MSKKQSNEFANAFSEGSFWEKIKVSREDIDRALLQLENMLAPQRAVRQGVIGAMFHGLLPVRFKPSSNGRSGQV